MNKERLNKFKTKITEYLQDFDSGKYNLDTYFSVINSHSLTGKQLKDILCWKLAGKREYKQLSPNHQHLIDRAVEKLHEINIFKEGKIPFEDFKKTLKYISPKGPVIQLFICHICKPEEYPLFDRHVYRAFQYFDNGRIHRGALTKKIIDINYGAYSQFFDSLYSCYRRLYSRKDIDSALMVFGKKLSKSK
jgi:hypothetical protein